MTKREKWLTIVLVVAILFAAFAWFAPQPALAGVAPNAGPVQTSNVADFGDPVEVIVNYGDEIIVTCEKGVFTHTQIHSGQHKFFCHH